MTSTGRDAIADALRESEERYRTLVESSPDAIIIVADETIRFSNRAARELMGQSSAAELVGMNMHDFAYLPSIEGAVTTIVERQDEGADEIRQPFTNENIHETVRTIVENSRRESATMIMAVEAGGDVRYLEARAVPTRWNSDDALQFSIRDVTAFKTVERRLHEYGERLKSLSRQLILAQEKERRAIAMELHDEAGQAVVSFQFHLQALMKNTTSDAQREEIARMTALLDSSYQKLRAMSLELRPSMLDDLGIVSALDWYVEELNAKSGVEVQFIHSAIRDDIPPDLASVCFRIAQEALTNVIRHAHAGAAVVELHQRGGALTLSVRDDGRGFDVPSMQSAAVRGRSMGLLGMQERAALAFGTIRIVSAPGAGTEVEAVFPLDALANTDMAP